MVWRLAQQILISSLVYSCLGVLPINLESEVPFELMDYTVTGNDKPIRLKCREFSKKKSWGVNDIMWEHKTCGSGLSLISCDELPPDGPWEYALCKNKTKLCTSPTLTISHPKEVDSGIYRCKDKNYMASNYKVNMNVLLEVTDPRMESMEIIPEDFDVDNQTIVENHTAVFRCRVRSVLRPHIVWFRVIDYYQGSSSPDVVMDGVPLRFVNGTETHVGPNKLYTSKLYLTNASVSDGGLYVCYVINEEKSLSKQVSLFVRPLFVLPFAAPYADNGYVKSEILWILLATILSATCCGLVMCLLFRRCALKISAGKMQLNSECGIAECSEHPLCR